MKITTNTVGNYSPAHLNKSNPIKPKENVNNDAGKVSVEEKKFFANMYPTQKTEIMEYQFYNSKGKVSGIQVGSLFDRRG